MLTTPVSYQLLASNLNKTLDQTTHQPAVKRASDYYLSKIGGIKSIDAFLGNDRIYQYAMKAFGLEDMTYAKAFMRKVLSEGIDNSGSFANKLSDNRFKEFATAFNFARYGGTATTFSRTQQGTVDRHIRQTLETDVGQSNEGVRLALYFQRTAPTVNSALGLLADKALLKVTQVALGLPASTSALNIDRQVDLIKKQLNVADLKDPAKLDRLLKRFTALWEIENPSGQASIAPTVLVGTATGGLDVDTLSLLQNLRAGR